MEATSTRPRSDAGPGGARAPAGAPWPTLGVEEELFVAEPDRPRPSSLWYLARLLARDPRHYYVHSASNLAWVTDMPQSVLGGVEFATRPHASVDALLAEVRRRRADLAWAVGASNLVAVGHLFDLDAPTLTCGLHVHVGVPLAHRDRAYRNLAYYLPLLMLASASSPLRRAGRFGPSYRIAVAAAIGPLGPDPWHRFQDLIVARRLGTIEVRALDPVWDLDRLRHILEAVRAIALLDEDHELDLERYRALREQACRTGYTPALRRLHRELTRGVDFPERLLERTAADEIAEWAERLGSRAAYRALDAAYREGALAERPPYAPRPWLLPGLAGFALYYLPRLPWNLWKQLRERGR